MQKNIDILSSINPKLTEKTIEIILKNATETSGKVLGWEIRPMPNRGDGFLSDVHRITINGEINGKIVNILAIIKTLPANKVYRKLVRSCDFFRNEIVFYNKVLPALENFIKSKGQPFILNIPKCLSLNHDGENDFIVLEDVTASGFQHAQEKSIVWSMENVKLILKHLAKFHGTGLAFYHQKPNDFLNATEDLRETLFSEDGWNWYKNQYTNTNAIGKAAITEIYPGSPEEKKFNSITAHEIFNKCIECCKPENKSPLVINHGDCWGNNFMTRNDQSGEKAAVMFDFQLARRGSPVLDISYFIYTCTDNEIREKYFWDFLKYYHTELEKILKQFGSNIDDIYPENLFMKDVQELFVQGVGFALDVVPGILGTYDPDESEEEVTDIGELWKIECELPFESKKRIADIIVHAVQQGFLK